MASGTSGYFLESGEPRTLCFHTRFLIEFLAWRTRCGSNHSSAHFGLRSAKYAKGFGGSNVAAMLGAG